MPKDTHTHVHARTHAQIQRENLVFMNTWSLLPIRTIAPKLVFMQKVPVSQQNKHTHTHTVNSVIQREQEKESIALRMRCEVVFPSLPSNVCHDLFQ